MAAGMPPEKAFRHVAEHYHWLATAACSLADWSNFTSDDIDDIRRVLPHVNVALQASAMIYARGLIEFYDTATSNNPNLRDIKAGEHFKIDVSAEPEYTRLVEQIKPSIDQHLCHISEFRAPANHVNAKSPVGRVEWGTEIPTFTTQLIRLLELASGNPNTVRQDLFVRLHEATTLRRSNRNARWPNDLSDPN